MRQTQYEYTPPPLPCPLTDDPVDKGPWSRARSSEKKSGKPLESVTRWPTVAKSVKRWPNHGFDPQWWPIVPPDIKEKITMIVWTWFVFSCYYYLLQLQVGHLSCCRCCSSPDYCCIYPFPPIWCVLNPSPRHMESYSGTERENRPLLSATQFSLFVFMATELVEWMDSKWYISSVDGRAACTVRSSALPILVYKRKTFDHLQGKTPTKLQTSSWTSTFLA